MRLPLLHRRSSKPTGSGVVGVARVDGRTKNLTTRLHPGDVAVIDHLDIDTVAAEALVTRRPSAVVNAVASTSGRYPNLGPQILLAAGIPLVDGVGHEVMVRLTEGDLLSLDLAVSLGGVVADSAVSLSSGQSASTATTSGSATRWWPPARPSTTRSSLQR